MPTGPYRWRWRYRPLRGFNPCSSGWCLPALTRLPGHSQYILVSILVLLDDAYRQGAGQDSQTWCRVSILVLLDDAYRHGGKKPAARCRQRVSILVLLDDAYRPFWFVSILYQLFQFQSLFFWMMPTGKELSEIVWRAEGSFNPCSSGWCLPASECRELNCWG